ncbi:MAG: hypothetical protein V2I37_12665 [Marinilabiliaceae bacterium]|jgi:hypothetical protein|nr:hypothetical protein [Marinilabiliaceae bacterium]
MNKILKLYLAGLLALLISQAAMPQESCKVLKVGIDSAYLGSCKKDLAHGVGEAWGRDHYYGEFRKGLPDGKGTYEYNNGSIYIGSFSKGLRHGYGEYTPNLQETDTIYAGIWEKDIFVGPEFLGGGYRIIHQQNVDRYKAIRSGDGNRVLLRINNNFTAKPELFDLSIRGSSGQEYTNSGYHGFNNVNYPFTLDVRYIKYNRLATALLEVVFEIEINHQGDWRIEIY